MRKDRYVKAFAEHLSSLRKLALSSGLDYDEANEVLGKCSEHLFRQKKYRDIVASRLKGFLRTNLRFEIQHFKREQTIQRQQFARIPDCDVQWMKQDVVQVINVVELPPVVECPFCFQANLNEYGACAMCHTILPSHLRLNKKGYSITEESLAVEFDFNTKLDVQNAIAKLNSFEQRVVRAVGLGTESLESFALDNQVSKSSLVRIWVIAKAKLQDSLREHAPKGVSKRGQNAFRRALQSVEKPQQN